MNTATIRKLSAATLAAAAMCVFAQAAASPAIAASDTASRAFCSNNLKQGGDVDGRDFLKWQGAVGSRASAGGASDLAVWQSCYGTGIY